MKLRVRAGSMRLRLTQAEVARLADGMAVEERVEVGPGALVYRVELADGAGPVSARLEVADGVALARVWLPRARALLWARSEEEGLEAEQPDGRGGTLRVLVQKDYACLAPRAGEEDAGAFPHPEAGERSCAPGA